MSDRRGMWPDTDRPDSLDFDNVQYSTIFTADPTGS